MYDARSRKSVFLLSGIFAANIYCEVLSIVEGIDFYDPFSNFRCRDLTHAASYSHIAKRNNSRSQVG